MKKIVVFCGSSLGFNPIYKQAAIELGDYFINNDITLVYGGGKIGMMGVLSESILKKGGKVIGVIPNLLKKEEVVNKNVTELIITKTMSERKVIMSQKCDAYLALAGGFGTLDEIFEALTLGQLGIESKPVAFLNTNGFYDSLLAQLDHMVKEGFLKQVNRDMIIVSDSIEDIFKQFDNYQHPIFNKIIQTTPDHEEH